MIPQEVVAPIESVTATSIMGWGGFVFGFVACVILVWDRVVGKGRAAAEIKGALKELCDKIEDLEGQLSVVNGLTRSVAELVYEWRGVDGSNGYKSIIRENQRRIMEIERRNTGIDAVRLAREEDERRSGGQHRRRMDRELNNLLPEEREERG